MDDLETLLRKLNERAIEDASRIDPAFAEKVREDREVLAQHERQLEAQRIAKHPTQEPIERRKPEPNEDDVPEKVILERVAKAMIERREL